MTKYDKLTMPFDKLNFEVKGESKVGDTRFLEVEIYLMHLGENYNGSYFAKDIVEKELDSLKNTPILGYIENEDYSDHRAELEVDKEGAYKFLYKGSAYGVIPETNNARFVERADKFGQVRTYLVVDGLMWTKWEESIDILSNSGFKSQSMELHEEYAGEFRDDGLFHFTEFKFFGACLLGDNVSPAMEGSTVQVKFEKSIQSDIKERLEEYHKFTSNQESNVTNDDNERNKFENERGNIMLSIEQIQEAIWEQLNPKNEDGYRSYSKGIIATFPEESKIIIRDNTDDNANYKKMTYTVSEEGVVALSDEEIMYGEFLTQSEKDEVERVRATLVSQEDYVKLEVEYDEYKKTVKTETEIASVELETVKNDFAKATEDLTIATKELEEIKPQLEEYTKEKETQEKLSIVDEFKLVSDEVKKVYVEKIKDYTKEELKSELTQKLIEVQEEILIKMSKSKGKNEAEGNEEIKKYAIGAHSSLFTNSKEENKETYADLFTENK